MAKLTEQRVERLEQKAEPADSNPLRVHIRPDLTHEEGARAIAAVR